jgi:uncharacterized membrane protein (DUF2068 family)
MASGLSAPISRPEKERSNLQRGPIGLRLIIGYKLVRGGAALTLAITLMIFLAQGHGRGLHALGVALWMHATNAWMLKLAHFILSSSALHRLQLGAIALAVDGLFTTFEGWALARGYTFAPWLVVVATASFLPWEMLLIVRHLAAGRIATLLVNALVVVYLARQALRERQAHKKRQSELHIPRG